MSERPVWVQTDLNDEMVVSVERTLRAAGQEDRADEFVRRAAEIMGRPIPQQAGEWRRTFERTQPGHGTLMTIRALAVREYVRPVTEAQTS